MAVGDGGQGRAQEAIGALAAPAQGQHRERADGVVLARVRDVQEGLLDAPAQAGTGGAPAAGGNLDPQRPLQREVAVSQAHMKIAEIRRQRRRGADRQASTSRLQDSRECPALGGDEGARHLDLGRQCQWAPLREHECHLAISVARALEADTAEQALDGGGCGRIGGDRDRHLEPGALDQPQGDIVAGVALAEIAEPDEELGVAARRAAP